MVEVKRPSVETINKAKRIVAKAVEKDDQKRLRLIFEQGYPVDTPLNRVKLTPMAIAMMMMMMTVVILLQMM